MVTEENKLILNGRTMSDSESENGLVSEKKNAFSFRKLPAKKKGMLLLLIFGTFIMCACFSVIAPIFPFEAQAKEMSTAVMGVVFSCFELVACVSAPVFGHFITNLGPKFLLVSGQFLAGVSAILFGMLDKSPPGTVFSVMCLVVRSFQAVGAAAVFTSSFTIMVNEFPDYVTTVTGLLETVYGTGWMAGPVLGGFLYELGGFTLPFWVLGCALLCSTVLSALWLDAPTVGEEKKEGSMFRLLTCPLVAAACVSLLFGGYIFGFIDSSLGLHLEKFGLSSMSIGLVYAMISGTYTASALIFGRISDKKGVKVAFVLILLANAVTGLFFLLLGPSPVLSFLDSKLWLTIVSLFFIGIAAACTIVTTMPCIYAGARALGFERGLQLDGLISGLFSSFVHLGVFLGPTIGNAVMQEAGFGWSATLSAGFVFISVTCFGLYALAEKLCLKHRIITGPDVHLYDVVETEIKLDNLE